MGQDELIARLRRAEESILGYRKLIADEQAGRISTATVASAGAIIATIHGGLFAEAREVLERRLDDGR